MQATPKEVHPLTPGPLRESSFVLDLFCGCASVTQASIEAQLPACAVGFYNPVAIDSLPFLSLDLAIGWAQQSILHVTNCKQSRTLLWIAPPCGTLSLARERPLPAWAQRAGTPSVGPLRSRKHLNGLPSALRNEKHAGKLTRANALLAFVFELVATAERLSLPWFIFNPRGRYLWLLPQWANLTWHDVDFDACAFGGRKKIRQRMRCPVPWLSSLA